MSFEINLGSVIGPTGPEGSPGAHGATGPVGSVGNMGPTGSFIITEAYNESGENIEIYGFTLDMDESDPASMISYYGFPNASHRPAHMDYTNDAFDYDSWGWDGDTCLWPIWFIRDCRPCILNFDGTVECYLDPDDYNYSYIWDYEKTESGSRFIKKRTGRVNIDENCVGNVMIEIPTVWIKVDTTNSRKPKFYFSSIRIDSTYHAYAHTNADGDVVPYIYVAAYEGWIDNEGRLRSVSGKLPSYIADIPGFYVEPGDCSPEYMIARARANNVSGDNIWDMTAFSERMLITLLLMLSGRSTNMQDVFGNGNTSGYQNPAEGAYNDFTTGALVGLLPTGTMNTRGPFWGTQTTNLGVKVFGIENFWGNYGKWTQGLICDNNGTLKYKLTRGTQDGSTATDYNTTGEGYLTAGAIDSVPNGGRYITDMYVGDFGLLPKSIGGDTASSSTYYCDWAYEEGVGFADFGGEFDSGCGPFCTEFHSSSNMGTITYITCKPHLNQ